MNLLQTNSHFNKLFHCSSVIRYSFIELLYFLLVFNLNIFKNMKILAVIFFFVSIIGAIMAHPFIPVVETNETQSNDGPTKMVV